MADTPSFTNLDQSSAENSVKTIQSQITNQINNMQNNTIAQTQKSINEISTSIKNLQNDVNNSKIMGGLQDEIDRVIKSFDELKNKATESVQVQKGEIGLFIDKITQMNEAIRQSNETLNKFNSIPIGDVNQIDEFSRKIANIKNSFNNLIETTDVINIKDEDLDKVKQKITGFMNTLTTDSMHAFNIADAMIKSSQDPNIKDAFVQMFSPINQMISQLPYNLVQSINSAQSQVSSSSGNSSIDELVKSMNGLTGAFNSSQNSTTQIAAYDANYINDRNQKNSDSATDIKIQSLVDRIDRITTTQTLAGNVDKNINNSISQSVNIENDLSDMLLKFMSGYTEREKRQIAEAGFSETDIKEMRSDIVNIQKSANQFNSSQGNIKSSTVKYQQAFKNYQQDSSPENLETLIKQAQTVDDQTKAATEALSEMLTASNKISEKFKDLSPEDFNKLPGDWKEVINSMSNIFTTQTSSARDLLKMFETFNIGTDEASERLKNSLKEATGEVSKMTDKMSELGNYTSFGDKMLDTFTKGKDVLSSALGIFGGITGFINDIGLGVGIPTSIKDMKSFAKGSVDWYKKFGEMDYESAMAQESQGGEINDQLLNYNRQMGLDLGRKTYNKIGYDDFANQANSLLTSVQGHYGQGGDKTTGQADMYAMTETAMGLNKLYNVDSTSAIQVFYKELGMSAADTNQKLLDLSNTALSANIPVSEYVKTIADMSIQFKNLGVDINIVEIGMRNLTLAGMSMSNAKELTSDMGQAINKYASDPGRSAFYGVMSGMFTDPYQSMWAVNDRWDSNGNVLTDGKATSAAMGGLSTQLGMMSQLYSGNESMQNWGIMNTLQGMGFNQKDSVVLTKKYQEGDMEGFEDLFEKMSDQEQTVTLKNQDDLENKLISAAEKTDELTKAENLVINIQQNLAQINKGILDMVGKSLQKVIVTLGASILKLDETIFGQFNGLTQSLGVIGTLIKGLIEHPILAVIAGIAAKMGIKSVANLSTVAKGAGVAGDLIGATKGANSISGLIKGSATAADVLGDAGAAASLGAKAAGKVPIVGGIIDGALAFFQSSGEGKTTGYAAGEAVGTGLGSAGGGWGGAAGGAALGTMIFPGVGTIIGGAIGGLGGGWLGGKAGKAVAGGIMDGVGVQEYKDTSSYSASDSLDNYSYDSGIDISGLYSSGRSYNSSLSSSLDEFNKMAGYNPEEQDAMINGINSKLYGSSQIEQQQTNERLNDLKDNQTDLSNRDNTLAQYTYSLHENKYSELIEKAKNEYDQLTNIANIMDSGFVFLDKILNSILQTIKTVGSSSGSSVSGTSGSMGNSGEGLINRDLTAKTAMTAEDINAWISSKAPKNSKMLGMGNAFIKASEESGLDPLYLVSHAALETGWGTSNILNSKNNWFGIGAFDSSPMQSAFGFNNMEAGIVEGAKWISKNYTNKGQNTLYEMVNDPNGHNYATDPLWANKIAEIMSQSTFANNSNSSSSSSLSNSLTSSPSSSSTYSTPSAVVTSSQSSGSSTSSVSSAAPIYIMGSVEYSNGTQHYNPEAFKNIPGDSYVYKDGQAVGRQVMEQYSSAYKGLDKYSSTISSYDDYSSAYNKQQKVANSFNININANDSDSSKYQAMSSEIQKAITGVVQQYMGSSAKIASVNYNRMNSEY